MSRGLTRVILTAAITACFALPMSPASAGTLTGGATEWTQILNNIQLIVSNINEVNNVKNTLHSAIYLKNTLKQLDPSTIARLAGVPLDQVNQLVNIDQQLTRLSDSAHQAQGVLNDAMVNGQRMGLSPSEYLARVASTAQKMGGTYKANYDADREKLQNLQQQSQTLQQTIDSAPDITSQVQGLQQLATQNGQLQASMISMNESITRQGMIASSKAQQEQVDKQAAANHAANEQQDWHAVKQMKANLPDQSKYEPGTENN